MDRTQKRRTWQPGRTSPSRNVCAHQIKRILTALLFGSCLALSPVFQKAHAQQQPEIFSYEELVELHEQPVLSPRLQSKLNRLLTTPFVNNDTNALGVSPLKPHTPELGRILRVASWNIERGLEYEAILSALGGRDSFSATLRETGNGGRTAKELESILQQAEMLRNADVIVLNEVDWGMKRTGYRNVVADLAAALKMNYAYGVEFVEVDPISMGLEKFDGAKAEDKTVLIEHTKVDQARYKGLHGTAILSRYRLENVRLIPYVNQPHDWYRDEKNGVAKLELGKREASEKVFLEKVLREVRRGGRMMLLADLEDPDLPLSKVTIVATHLESRTKPAYRARQLQELLTQIRDIKNPVIVAGDMNTSSQDMTPTSILREIRKRLGSKSFWAHQGIKYATGAGLVFDVIIGGLQRGRTHADPTVRSIPLVSTNPEAKFFGLLKDFRFGDGGVFDFRGGEGRAVGDHSGPLANSNQRGQKGFVTTYEVRRTLSFVGKYKLDWIFVKPPDLTQPDNAQQPYRFAPHFGRTLVDLNESIKDHISDHNPIIVDLPLDEPAQARNKLERKKTKAS